MATGSGSFSKTVGSSSSRWDPMLIFSYLPRGGDVGTWNASSPLLAPAFLFSNYLPLPGGGTGLAGIEVDGTSDVASGAGGIYELSVVISGTCNTVVPGPDTANGTKGGGGISSTTPTCLILNFGTLEK
ncbi:hypothetical protein Fot_41444 [Forsythia ovata]|uniref:Uncharacterized protein n=1 Tax=Forsythia ovata TaxID=205694 RepID=A0ABD1RJP6_9LAMI